MNKKNLRLTPIFCILLLGLTGCSSGKLGSWFGAESKKNEVAYVPPTTAAPESDSKIYQSGAYQAAEKSPAGEESKWGLEEVEPKSESTFSQAVGDVGYVSAPPTVPQAAPTVPANGVFRGGTPAPRIAATTFDGQMFDSAAHLGKVVLVDFWFRECGPCIRALPKVDALRQAYSKDQLSIVAVNHDRQKSTAVAYLQRNPHDWPQIYDRELPNSLVKAYGVTLFPTFVVIDQMGNIQYKGSSIDAASSKVAELVRVPSIPSNSAPVGVIAAGPRTG